MTAEQLKSLIAAGLPCDHLTLEGDGRHWYATIVSPAFEGRRAIARHQQVYATLGARNLQAHYFFFQFKHYFKNFV